MLIENLSFKFDNSNSSDYFFKDLTVYFIPNHVHFIQGDNGVGKSTFFAILQGAIDKKSFLLARIRLNELLYSTDNNQLPDTFTKQVHTVQQNYDNMIANQFTFMENVQLAHLPKYPSLKSFSFGQAGGENALLDSVALFSINVDKPAYLLSGGQRQLLAIVMALQKPTHVLLLDEPTATLDKKNAFMIIESLKRMAQNLGITILVTCHDKEVVEKYAQGNSFTIKQSDSGNRTLMKDG